MNITSTIRPARKNFTSLNLANYKQQYISKKHEVHIDTFNKVAQKIQINIPNSKYTELIKQLKQFSVALAVVAGGAMLATSCQPAKETDIISELTYNKKILSPVQTKLLEWTKDYGLAVIKADNFKSENTPANQGIIEYGYHDKFWNTDKRVRLNEKLSTSDTLVFDGTVKDAKTGYIDYARDKISAYKSGLKIEKLFILNVKPNTPIKESEWISTGFLRCVKDDKNQIWMYKQHREGAPENYFGSCLPKTSNSFIHSNSNFPSPDVTDMNQLYEMDYITDYTNVVIVVNDKK